MVPKCFEILLTRMKEAFAHHQKLSLNMSTTVDYMKVDLQNQLQCNLNLSYENMLLQSKEAQFKKIIEEKKRHDRNFKENCSEAQDFLESETLISKI